MRHDIGVAGACELLGITKQAWYSYHQRSFEEAVDKDRILECIHQTRIDMPGMGGRKLQVVLKRDYGIDMGRDSLFSLLREQNLLIKQRIHRTRTTFSDHGLRVYPDLRKDFVPTGINQLWVADITYIWLGKEVGFHYLFLITDAYSKKIVGWSVADNMRHENAVAALRMALKQCRKGDRPIHHSDKGLQYCAKAYVAILNRRKIQISMTEGYDPRSNGIAERVNGILKEEFLKYENVNAGNIEGTLSRIIEIYHTRRPHLSLGMLTPEQVHNGELPGRKLWKKYYLKDSA
ncbi:MAG: IS3 family transposase [Duncaniella sp.]|nr:IS3 family transposase [Duncaniella sp.]